MTIRVALAGFAAALCAGAALGMTAAEINDRTAAPTLAPGASGAAVVRLQVLLDRAHCPSGEIDGRFGANTMRAVEAFRRSRMLAEAGPVGPITWGALLLDLGPEIVPYVLTKRDVSGPFSRVPRDMMEKARLPALRYASPVERLGEKFHVSPALLAALNPRQSFRRAGRTVQVPLVERPALPAAGELDVSDSDLSVTVWGRDGRFLARYPATLSGAHDPLCYGSWKVLWVRRHPRFHYDPKLFWDAPPGHSKATLPPGPNSPVGVAWIQLSVPSCGIHGTAEPSRIGTRESHGCIRLTNWDARELSLSVKKGTRVEIVM